VNLEGTITVGGGRITLRSVDKSVTETCVLTATAAADTGSGVVETFSYTTTDGLCAGTFVLHLQSPPQGSAVPSQIGTFQASFC
jgi:hypothetical protein